MNPYLLAVLALLFAAIAETSIAWMATECFLQKARGRRQGFAWLAIALGAGFLALQQGYILELALRTGLYDLRQAVLAAVAALFFALGTYGLKPATA